MDEEQERLELRRLRDRRDEEEAYEEAEYEAMTTHPVGMEQLTDARLAELEALCKAATPGPWFPWESPKSCQLVNTGLRGEPSICMCYDHTKNDEYDAAPNADFIAAARTALPEALAEVRRLAADNARLRALVQSREWDSEGFCLWCYALQKNGHIADCPWLLALGGDA